MVKKNKDKTSLFIYYIYYMHNFNGIICILGEIMW